MGELVDPLSIVLFSALGLMVWPGAAVGMWLGAWYILPGASLELAGFTPALAAVLAGAIVASLRYRRREKLTLLRGYLWSFIFLGTVFLREVMGTDSITTAGTIAAPIVLGLGLILTARHREPAIQVLVGFAAAGTVYGIAEIQRIFAGGALHAGKIAYDANPVFAGQFLGLSALAVLTLWGFQRVQWWVAAPWFIILAGSLMLTLSRGPIIALCLAIVVMYMYLNPSRTRSAAIRKQLVLLACVVASFFVYGYLLRGRTSEIDNASVDLRQDFLVNSIGTIISNPLLGTGTGVLFSGSPEGATSPVRYPHNIYLEVWATYGVIPFIALAGGLIWSLVKGEARGRSFLVFAIVSFAVSGTMTVSINFWIAVALSAIVSGLETQVRDGNPSFTRQTASRVRAR